VNVRLALGVTLLLCCAATTFAQPSQKPMRAAGRVDTVTQESVTILLAGTDRLTVGVDATTKVIGKGLSTRARELKTAGRSPSVLDLVKASDHVVVTYVDGGSGQLRAREIHVRSAAR
jgi:hypothetical protein